MADEIENSIGEVEEKFIVGQDNSIDNSALLSIGEDTTVEDTDITDPIGDESVASVEDPELEAIKARVREMEEEAEKLKEMQNEVEKQMNMSSPGASPSLSLEDKVEVDARSVYVGNVDYSATAENLEVHFHGCGSINRVTILCDKFSGHPKGFAFIEFTDKDSVETAMALDESLFKGRQIKVLPKRTNRPGLTASHRGAPVRGGRFRRGRGNYNMAYYSGYVPRARGSRFRRRAHFYAPY